MIPHGPHHGSLDPIGPLAPRPIVDPMSAHDPHGPPSSSSSSSSERGHVVMGARSSHTIFGAWSRGHGRTQQPHPDISDILMRGQSPGQELPPHGPLSWIPSGHIMDPHGPHHGSPLAPYGSNGPIGIPAALRGPHEPHPRPICPCPMNFTHGSPCPMGPTQRFSWLEFCGFAMNPRNPPPTPPCSLSLALTI